MSQQYAVTDLVGGQLDRWEMVARPPKRNIVNVIGIQDLERQKTVLTQKIDQERSSFSDIHLEISELHILLSAKLGRGYIVYIPGLWRHSLISIVTPVSFFLTHHTHAVCITTGE